MDNNNQIIIEIALTDVVQIYECCLSTFNHIAHIQKASENTGSTRKHAIRGIVVMMSGELLVRSWLVFGDLELLEIGDGNLNHITHSLVHCLYDLSL